MKLTNVLLAIAAGAFAYAAYRLYKIHVNRGKFNRLLAAFNRGVAIGTKQLQRSMGFSDEQAHRYQQCVNKIWLDEIKEQEDFNVLRFFQKAMPCRHITNKAA